MSWHRNAALGLFASLGTLGLSGGLVFAGACTATAQAAPAKKARLSLVPVEHSPKEGRVKPTDAKLTELRKAVADAPEDRGRRFELVRALLSKGDPKAALAEAKAWREKDAYNLVVVRLIGDIHTELGEADKARRAYSAVVELLPKDPEAHRALASVLKAGGDLDSAHARLMAATKLAPEDVRLGFELADVAHRLGRLDEARERFQTIVDSPKAMEAVRYPAKQRLAQILAADRRTALGKGDTVAAKALQGKIDALGIKGGTQNDLKVYLSWDTDRTDVDLWVEVPGGEKVSYEKKESSHGEALYDDVTSGYGPESFTAHKARPGAYVVKVNYYGTSRSTFTEARGEVVVILGEGTPEEVRHVLPYQLFAPKQTVTIARIEVAS